MCLLCIIHQSSYAIENGESQTIWKLLCSGSKFMYFPGENITTLLLIKMRSTVPRHKCSIYFYQIRFMVGRWQQIFPQFQSLMAGKSITLVTGLPREGLYCSRKVYEIIFLYQRRKQKQYNILEVIIKLNTINKDEILTSGWILSNLHLLASFTINEDWLI